MQRKTLPTHQGRCRGWRRSPCSSRSGRGSARSTPAMCAQHPRPGRAWTATALRMMSIVTPSTGRRRTSELHDRDAVNDGTRLGVDIEEGEGVAELAELLEQADVVEQHLGVLDVVIWDVLDMHVVPPARAQQRDVPLATPRSARVPSLLPSGSRSSGMRPRGLSSSAGDWGAGAAEYGASRPVPRTAGVVSAGGPRPGGY